MGGHAKGSSFERDICRQLSVWWTNGKRDDVFWRSSNSGGRATVRSRQGKKTFGQYGDIQATDPIGQPLIDLCTFELKRGYNRVTLQDILDRPEKGKKTGYEIFFKQCRRERKEAHSKFWCLIHKRDRREPLIFMPYGLFNLADKFEGAAHIILYTYFGKVVGITLEQFFQHPAKKFLTNNQVEDEHYGIS